jgi:hypothetical protein
MFVICWDDEDPTKDMQGGVVPNSMTQHWEVVSGYDEMQVRVSKLVESGIPVEDIVVGEVTEDTM